MTYKIDQKSVLKEEILKSFGVDINVWAANQMYLDILMQIHLSLQRSQIRHHEIWVAGQDLKIRF